MKWRKSDSDEKRVDIENAHGAGVDAVRRRALATKRRPRRAFRAMTAQIATVKNTLFHRTIFDSEKTGSPTSVVDDHRKRMPFVRDEERLKADVDKRKKFSSRKAVTVVRGRALARTRENSGATIRDLLSGFTPHARLAKRWQGCRVSTFDRRGETS
jgi:hypothetical protein